MRRESLGVLLHGSWPVDENDEGCARETVACIPYVDSHGWANGRLWWTLHETDNANAPLLPGDLACRHMVIQRRLSRCVSEHRAQAWE